jgi:hypothetical protein
MIYEDREDEIVAAGLKFSEAQTRAERINEIAARRGELLT